MGLAGAGYGAGLALEDIVARKIEKQKIEQAIAQENARMQLEQAALNQRSVEHSDRMRAQQRDDDRQDADRRRRDGIQGVRRMMGERIVQGTGEMGPEDRRGLAALQIEAGDEPTMLNAPKVERDPIADHEAKARIDAKYRAPRVAPAAPRTPLWVRQPDGSVVDLNGVAPPGTKPYDAVAERSSKPLDNGEAVDTAREARRIASELRQHKGMPRAFGVVDSVLPTINQSTADAESLRDALTSLLTLENMGKMKGVLSDADMKVLRQASTTINPRMGDAAARAELDRIVEVMSRVTGDAAPTIGTPAPGAGGGLADLVYDPVTKTLKPRGGQ